MNKYRIVFEGKTYEMEIELVSGNVTTQNVEKKEQIIEKKESPVANNTTNGTPKTKAPLSSGAVVSPIPGTIIKILKKEGDQVKTGDVVLVLEAMKMENEVVSPANGKIKKMNCSAGSTVAGGELLFEVE